MKPVVPEIEVCTGCIWKAAVRPATLFDRMTGSRRVVCRLAVWPFEVSTVRRRPGTRCSLRADALTREETK